MDEILKLSRTQQKEQEMSQELFIDKVEIYLKDHLELNFFQMRIDSKKLDDQYFNENVTRQFTEKTNFDYSIGSLGTFFNFLAKFEKQSLDCRDVEYFNNFSNIEKKEAIFTEKKFFNYCQSTQNVKNKLMAQPKNLVDYLIASHITKITQEIYNAESTVNNYEVENKLSLSLFILKKTIKDYSFYFEKKPELERVFMALKKFKE